jgi:hypothetical protein
MLEHEFGVTALRAARPLCCQGKHLLPTCASFQAELQRSRDEMEQMSGRLTGQVSIGQSMGVQSRAVARRVSAV